ncbi:MAG: HAD hydrolase-like protein [Thermoleophilia bacterium]|nr:HAD hydrolase-like protein [Thermoleophilia bacterium]
MTHIPPDLTRTRRPFRVAGVVFDLDGTLTKPGAIDFARVREALGCPQGVGILEYLQDLSDPAERLQKEALLRQFELQAVELSERNEGAQELLAFLQGKQIPVAIVTRNCREAARAVLARTGLASFSSFALIITRDDGLSPKPHPDSIQFVARQLQVPVSSLLVVGDHRFDIEAGLAAGALTMLLRSSSVDRPVAREEDTVQADFVVTSLYEALRIIDLGLSLPTGKLPAHFLERALAGADVSDAAVLVPAAVGEDAAVIDIDSEEILVLASDPITLAASSMAHYAVLVNANDVAVAGANPRWLLTTLIFPPGTSASEILKLVDEIRDACRQWGVTLCGGHTEISDAVSRPLVVGMMAGTARKRELINKRDMQEGDRILLTKRVAVEGTGLLAREYAERLRSAGWSEQEIGECAAFLNNIGIIEEARIARGFVGVTALHDVTEGGLATAVWELGAAGGRRLRLYLNRIPIYPQTKSICSVFGLNPLGLIGSGSLLITCSPAQVPDLVRALTEAGIEVTEIGEVLEEGEGIEAWDGAKQVEWPRFERDEVSRVGG